MASEQISGARKKLGAILRQHRIGCECSIEYVSGVSRISTDELEAIEDGRSVPSESALREFANVYRLGSEDSRKFLSWRTDARREEDEESRSTDTQSLARPIDRALTESVPRQNMITGPGIFISYRRSDQPWYARTLCTKLRDKFREVRVFIDIDDIGPGADFAAVIDAALSKCVVLIVVIGKGWLNAADSTGARRLDDPEDLVCMEIERALARHIPVIPILVDGASMPRRADLPESLRPLARLNGQEMSYDRFGQDCWKLISTLERIFRTSREVRSEQSGAESPSAGTTTQDPNTPLVYSSNDFNVAVTKAIQQAWRDLFNERFEMHVSRTRDDGGADGLLWPVANPDVKVSFRTFPSPETTLRSAEAIEILRASDTPCLIVTRLALNQWTRDAIERSYSPPVQFLHWTCSDDDKKSLEMSIRKLRESLSQSP